MDPDTESLEQLSDLEQTMLVPLWGRATYSPRYPDLLDDPRAVEVVAEMQRADPRLREAFEQFEGGEYYGLVFMARARQFDDALVDYLDDHPAATVVNLGAGLDTTFARVDNGQLRWYNLDLPEAIEYRQRFLPEAETSRCTCIAADAFDPGWMDAVEFSPDRGIFFLAGGLFMYYPEAKVRAFFQALARRFPGGEIIFDVGSRLGKWIANRRSKKAGKDTAWQFGVGNPDKKFPPWSPRIEMVEWHVYWEQVEKNPAWERKTRKIMKISDCLKLGKIVRLRFTSGED